jgi:hypothetical protein
VIDDGIESTMFPSRIPYVMPVPSSSGNFSAGAAAGAEAGSSLMRALALASSP